MAEVKTRRMIDESKGNRNDNRLQNENTYDKSDFVIMTANMTKIQIGFQSTTSFLIGIFFVKKINMLVRGGKGGEGRNPIFQGQKMTVV